MSAELLPPPVFPVELSTWNESVPPDWILPSIGDVAIAQRESGIFVRPGHDVLRTPALPVTDQMVVAGGLERVRQAMLRAADTGRLRRLVGVAAPQVGEPYQVIAANLEPGSGENLLTWLYNPRVVKRSAEMYDDNEGCFSCYNVHGRVPRHLSVTIEADNLDKPLTLTDTPGQHFQIAARIVQHEIDHLQGIRFPDLLATTIRADPHNKGILWWTHAEYNSLFPKRPDRIFPPNGTTPYLHHARMLRTQQTTHPWFDALSVEQWEAIGHNGTLWMPLAA